MSQKLLLNRTFQYIGIMLVAGVFGVAYWYFSVRAGFNTSSSEQEKLNTGLTSGLVGYWPFDGNDVSGLVVPDAQSYWPLDEGTGTTASDAASNTNTGTLQGSPAWTTSGKFSNAVTFDGTNDEITTTTSFTNPQVFTVSLWLKTSTSSGKKVFGFENSQTGTGSTQYDRHITFGSDGKIRFGIYNAGFYEISSSGTYADGNWHHVVGTFNGSTSTLYIDGTSQGTSSPGGAENYNGYWRIGGYRCGTGGWTNCSDGYFNGTIDDVRIYTRALPAADVSSLYAMTTPTAYDRSGSGNNGTLVNGPKAAPGKSGQGLDFDGANNYVNAGAVHDFTSQDFTISHWIKLNSLTTGTGGQGPIPIYKGSYQSNGYYVQISTTGGVYFYTNQSGANQLSGTPVGTIVAGEWYHLTYARSGSSVKIYVNGIDKTSTIGTHTNPASSSSNFQIGHYSSSGSIGVDGVIDEVRVYSRTLSATEAQALYQVGASDKINAVEARSDALTSGLVGYWRLDEGSGTTTADSSGNGNTLSFGDAPAWATGKFSGGLDFDGVNDYLATTTLPSTSSTHLTMSVWTYWQQTSSSTQVIVWNGTAATNGYGLIIGNGAGGTGNNVTIALGGVAYNVTGSTQVLPSNEWAHLVMTRDGSTWKLYLNGVMVPGTGTTNSNTPTGSFSAGGYFDGILDDIRFYKRALSAAEVSELYRETNPANPDANLVGYWTLDGQDTYGTTTLDRSMKGNAGTLVNTPTPSGGKVNQAFTFNGSSQYVNSGNVSLGGLSAFSMSGWFKRSAANAHLTVGKAASGSDGKYLSINFYNDGQVYLNIGNDVSNLRYGQFASNDTEWHHVTLVFDGSQTGDANKLKAYVDGYQQGLSYGGTAASFPAVTPSSSDDFLIGRNIRLATYSNGRIDEVRVYNKALTAAEAKSVYELSRERSVHLNAADLQEEASFLRGLVGHWKLDDGSGSSATNAVVGGLTGTLLNTPTWTTGQVNGALSFDSASSEYVDYTGPVSTRTNDWAIAAWINPSNINQGGFVVHNGYDDGASTYSGYGFGLGNGAGSSGAKLQGLFSGVTWIDTGYTFPAAGTWYHVVMTRVSGFTRFYVNGVSTTYGSAGTPNAPTNDFRIGTIAGSSGRYFAGSIDDVRFYDRGLSPEEAYELYQNTSATEVEPGLVGYWSFNGTDISGTSARDVSGKGNTGTLTNSPAVTSGKSGQGLSFDGSNDYVTIANNSAFDFGASQDFTVSAWVRTTQAAVLNTYPGIFAKENGSSVRQGYSMFLHNSNVDARWRFEIWVSDVSYHVYGASDIADGNWHHVAGVRSGSTIYAYQDGVLANTNSSASSASLTKAINLEVGRLGSHYLNGKIDEPRVYNRALSATEIADLYNRGR